METPVFLEDIFPPDLLYAVTIRSPIAKGRLKLIHFPKLPENYTLITARNIPGENRLEDTFIPILAETKVSYIGEPVALLLGQDKIKLEEIARQSKVLVDEEEPVFSCIRTNESNSGEPPALMREILLGNTQGIFEKTGKIVTGSYTTGIQDHWYAEPTGAVTWYNNTLYNNDERKTTENLVVRTATQWPHHVKRSVARTLGIDQSVISVEPTSLSIHMDGKLMFTSLVACHAAIGTYITKRPVRLILNREENFFYSPKRCQTSIDIASSIDSDGKITGTEAEILVNLGAYEVNAREILDQVCLGMIGLYKMDNIKIIAKAARTNLPPQGPFSGFGMAQGFFAMERHISQISDFLNKDPAELRKTIINPAMILPAGSLPYKNHASGEELIKAAASMSDYYRKWASYELLRHSRKKKSLLQEKGETFRGIGIALGFQGNGLLYFGEDKGNYGVEVTLTKGGTLEIRANITSSDEDYQKIWEKIAAEILSIEPSMVHLVKVQTPDCGPSCASRNITTLTKLVERCCHAIRKQRFHNPLPIMVRRSVKPQNGALWNDNFKSIDERVMDITGFSKLGLAAAVVEVTIDLIECIPKIRGVWLGVDGGKIISENRARRSLSRAVNQALGWTFSENIEYINGLLPKSKYDNFILTSQIDIPLIEINFLSSDCSEPKGIGDLPFTCIPAAFIQAVSQAMDHCFKTIPLKRKEIWEIVRIKTVETNTQRQK